MDTISRFFQSTQAVKVLMATKMVYLMKSILNENPQLTQKIQLNMTNDPSGVVEEAVRLKPGLIVLDVDLFIVPSAQDVVRLLRERPELKETTVLLTRSLMGDPNTIAGSREPERSVEDCLARGASHFMGSLNKSTFMKVIEEYCRTNSAS